MNDEQTDPAPAKTPAVCHRCGQFFADDPVFIHDYFFCLECSQLPEVDYLGHFKSQYWGRRNLAVIAVSMVSLLWLGLVNMAVIQAWSNHAMVLIVVTICAFVTIYELLLIFDFLSLKPGSLYKLPIIVGITSFLRLASTMDATFEELIGVLIFVVIGMVAVPQTPILRLAFQTDISEAQLETLYHRLADNPAARYGLHMSFLGFVVPGLAIVSLCCSIYGLAIVDKRALPPIGNRDSALAGIAMSIIDLVVHYQILVHWVLV